MSAIFTVSELTRSVKNLLEAEFPFVWVRGQISNLARPGSGHVYFTLTDGDAALSVVWFKSAQRSARTVEQDGEAINPLTGEVEEKSGPPPLTGASLEDGLEVLCAGRLNVYEPRGQYQLVAELVQDQGVGDLALAFEALKRKLAAKGYFDDDRKISIPRNPKRVAVITSPTGAAIRDFLRIADARGTGSQIRIYPTLVQGEQAPEQIADALDQADGDGWADLLVLIRGGGSIEDLWAFNTEPVADAIYRTRLPVVCGVGHEPDVTIADYVADLRAATPSHAAQEIWSRREALAQQVDDLEMMLMKAYADWLQGKADRLDHLRKGLSWLSPAGKVERATDRFAHLLDQLNSAGTTLIEGRQDRVATLMGRLERSYGARRINRKRDETLALLHRLDAAYGPQEQDRAGESVARMVDTMDRSMTSILDDTARRLELTMAGLRGADPQAPLERGYAMVRVERTGEFLRDPAMVTTGDELAITVKHGRVDAVVATKKQS